MNGVQHGMRKQDLAGSVHTFEQLAIGFVACLAAKQISESGTGAASSKRSSARWRGRFLRPGDVIANAGRQALTRSSA